MKYVVKVVIGASNYWLRRTIWTGNFDRADQFDTREAALEALLKARKYMAARIYKLAEVREVK